jgi:hypothetical protein
LATSATRCVARALLERDAADSAAMELFVVKWLENALCFLQSDIFVNQRSVTRWHYEWADHRYWRFLELYASLSEAEKEAVYAEDVMRMSKLVRDQAASEFVQFLVTKLVLICYRGFDGTCSFCWSRQGVLEGSSGVPEAAQKSSDGWIGVPGLSTEKCHWCL